MAQLDQQTAIQSLHRLLTQAGTGSWPTQFMSNANNGILQSIQSLMSGGTAGASGGGNILGAFMAAASIAQNMAQNQTNAQANNQTIPASFNITQVPANTTPDTDNNTMTTAPLDQINQNTNPSNTATTETGV